MVLGLVQSKKPVVIEEPKHLDVKKDIDNIIEECSKNGVKLTNMQIVHIQTTLDSLRIMDESFKIAENTKDEITRSSRLELALKHLNDAEKRINQYDLPLSISNKDELLADYYKLSRMDDDIDSYDREAPVDLDGLIGKPWGEIVSELTGDVNLVDGKQTWEYADDFKHDLSKMLQCCHAELKTMEQAGQLPAPFYFERAAILFRKQKQYEKEVQVVELYLDAVKAWNKANGNRRPNGSSTRHEKIVHRLTKAKQLAAKQKQLDSKAD